MNITEFVLATSVTIHENKGMLTGDNLIYIGAIIGLITGSLILAIHCIVKKKLREQKEQRENTAKLEMEITL
jgi:hypothetical protein